MSSRLLAQLAKAAGTSLAGGMVAAARAAGADELSALRVPVLLFGVAALLKAMLYAMLSPEVEAKPDASREEQGHGGGRRGG